MTLLQYKAKHHGKQVDLEWNQTKEEPFFPFLKEPVHWDYGVSFFHFSSEIRNWALRELREHREKYILLEIRRKILTVPNVDWTRTYIQVQVSDPQNPHSPPKQFWIREEWAEPLVKETYSQVEIKQERSFKNDLIEKLTNKWKTNSEV